VEARIMEEAVFIAVTAMGLLGGLGRGAAGGDVVSLLPTDTYLQSRRIPLNIENLERLARTEPKTGKAQILQLMALRALAETPELVKKNSTALGTIEKIARGELARDRLGFSEEYGRRTLLALGIKTTLPRAAQAADLRKEALGWFPASSTLVGFVGGGPPAAEADDYAQEIRKFLSKLVRKPRDWNELFNGVELIGNARIERIGFAYATDGKEKGQDRVYIRITGKVDHQRIVAALKAATTNEGTKWQESKDANGTPIATIHFPGGGSAVAFIGDTDLLLGFHVNGSVGGLEVVQQLLAVRAGKDKSVLEGALQDRLPKLAPAAVGLLVGDLPEEARLLFKQAELDPPKSIRVEVGRAKGGVDARFQAVFENAEAATSFAKSAAGLRRLGLHLLKKTQADIKDDMPVPRSMVASLQKALESVRLQADGAAIKGTMSVPAETLWGGLWLQLRFMGAVGEPPLRPDVAPEPKETRLFPLAPLGRGVGGEGSGEHAPADSCVSRMATDWPRCYNPKNTFFQGSLSW
jgi:hypothetical protein